MTLYRRAAVVSALLLTSLTLGTLQHSPSVSAHTGASPVVVTVLIQNYAFSPATVTVHVGTTIRWIQKDNVPHTVTSNTNAFPSSINLNLGDTYSYTFTKAGSFGYYCSVHPTMTGVIKVVAGSSTSSGTSPAASPLMGSTSMGSGYLDSRRVTFTLSDSSNKTEAAQHHIAYNSRLARVAGLHLPVYVVTNGQFVRSGPVFTTAGGTSSHSLLFQEITVTWSTPVSSVLLTSQRQIFRLQKRGSLTVKTTNIYLKLRSLR